jgi:AcrR family transcriptional regulator
MVATPGAARKARTRRRIVEATVSLLRNRGLSRASVDDIVEEAGVAKGTFYLYFDSKDAVISAVAQRLVEGVGAAVEQTLAAADRSPVERVLALGGAVSQVGREPYERELIEVFHRPENRVVHDRVGEHAMARIAPSLAAVIAEGIAAGQFLAQDPDRAARYVLACFGALHDVIHDPDEVPAAMGELNAFVLRALGTAGDGAP